MGKTIRNYIGKNRTHENARPYERTRERITDFNHEDINDEDPSDEMEVFLSDESDGD